MRRASVRALPALLVPMTLLAAAACTPRVLVTSDPVGAEVRMNRVVAGTTPVELELPVNPLRRPTARVSFPGHRAVTLEVGRDRRAARRLWYLLTFRWRRAFCLVPTASHEVILVPQHGGAGTWTEEDVP